MKMNWPAFRCGCLIVASAVLGGMASAGAQEATSANGGSAARISSGAITQAPQRAAIRVEGVGRLDVHASRMQNPERLVLDFAGARMGVQKTTIAGVSAPVLDVRLGQFRPDIARVVVDLTTAAPYQIAHEGEAVVIYFETSTVPAEAVSLAAPVRSTSTGVPADKPAEKAQKEIALNNSSPRNASTKIAKIAPPKFALPKELTQPSSVLASMKNQPERPARPEGSQQTSQQ